jgi:hypothetical protein
VPALKLSSLLELKRSLEEGIVAFNVEGRGVDDIVDNLCDTHAVSEGGQNQRQRTPAKGLTPTQFAEIKNALNQRVKLRMKLNLLGKMTSVAESTAGLRSAPTSRQGSKESLDKIEGLGEEKTLTIK